MDNTDIYARWARAHRFDWIVVAVGIAVSYAMLIAIAVRGSALLMP